MASEDGSSRDDRVADGASSSVSPPASSLDAAEPTEERPLPSDGSARAARDVAWAVRVVPQHGGRVREFTVTATQLRRLRVAAALVVVVVVGLAGGLAASVPRSLAYEGLLQENLSLKLRLQEIDRRMAEIDRILLRLRLYDAQLESLATPRGDHGGPLPRGVMSNSRFTDEEGGLSDEMPLDGAFDEAYPAMFDDGLLDGGADDREPAAEGEAAEEPHWSEGSELRPAEAWGLAVQARADTFLSLFARAEPNLNQLMGELEGLRALDNALPSLWPADGSLTSGFGWRRNPLGQSWRFHSGIDLAGRRGEPIYAAAPGRVVRARYNSGYGRMIEIDHGYGITSVYAHCHVLRVQEGQFVDRGDLIGAIGSTGRSTGPHLHFEVRLDGHAVDPLDYLPR